MKRLKCNRSLISLHHLKLVLNHGMISVLTLTAMGVVVFLLPIFLFFLTLFFGLMSLAASLLSTVIMTMSAESQQPQEQRHPISDLYVVYIYH